jgi:hypothetical protein
MIFGFAKISLCVEVDYLCEILLWLGDKNCETEGVLFIIDCKWKTEQRNTNERNDKERGKFIWISL